MNSLQKVFSDIYDQYVDKIYRFVFLKVNSQEIAEDITSEVFLRGWEAFQAKNEKLKAQNEKGIENLPAFLYQIARNLIIDHYRIKSQIRLVSAETTKNLVDSEAKLEKWAFIESDLQLVKAALAKINDEYREVIVWHYLDEFSVAEISKMLNKSEGAVRVMLHRALRTLKDELI